MTHEEAKALQERMLKADFLEEFNGYFYRTGVKGMLVISFEGSEDGQGVVANCNFYAGTTSPFKGDAAHSGNLLETVADVKQWVTTKGFRYQGWGWV